MCCTVELGAPLLLPVISWSPTSFSCR